MVCKHMKNTRLDCEENMTLPGTSESQGQGHKIVNVNIIWKCMTQAISTSNTDTVPCKDQNWHARLKFT